MVSEPVTEIPFKPSKKLFNASMPKTLIGAVYEELISNTILITQPFSISLLNRTFNANNSSFLVAKLSPILSPFKLVLTAKLSFLFCCTIMIIRIF